MWSTWEGQLLVRLFLMLWIPIWNNSANLVLHPAITLERISEYLWVLFWVENHYCPNFRFFWSVPFYSYLHFSVPAPDQSLNLLAVYIPPLFIHSSYPSLHFVCLPPSSAAPHSSAFMSVCWCSAWVLAREVFRAQERVSLLSVACLVPQMFLAATRSNWRESPSQLLKHWVDRACSVALCCVLVVHVDSSGIWGYEEMEHA